MYQDCKCLLHSNLCPVSTMEFAPVYDSSKLKNDRLDPALLKDLTI